jgi:predicted O-linked N-acetylglucosamine transferase (SPINDLY family)
MDTKELLSNALSLQSEGKSSEEVVMLYDNWLSQNGTRTDSAPVWFNFGVSLSDLGLKAEASRAYENSIKLNPKVWQATSNLANLLENEGKVDEAIAQYRQLLPYKIDKEGTLHALNQMGRLLEKKRDFQGALNSYDQSLAIDPEQQGTFQHWFSVKQKLLDWPLETFPAPLTHREIAERMGSISAMAYFDDPLMQKITCDSWISRFREGKNYRYMADRKYSHRKIRIGYLSCDFRAHAVCFLNFQMFAAHNREHFEVYGFDYTKEEDTPWRKIAIQGFDHHIPIHHLDDEAAATLIRNLEIDILVDLVGLTSSARPGIILFKPAPVQVSYLGFLGPVGMPEIDYIVCDDYVIPPDQAKHYGAKPLYVPFYQVNNQQRVASAAPTRASLGLPEKAFVFCAINNSYKITPPMFRRWVTILQKTTNSVLWMLAEHEQIETNIRREFGKYGLPQERLILSRHAQPADYLAQFTCADLYLDASPYNAGITGSDAVWMGLPVLTCPGNTFVSRMAADLMLKLNLPEFVCSTWTEYIQKAIGYSERRDAKRLLTSTLDRSSFVFDTTFFVRALERKFYEIQMKD